MTPDSRGTRIKICGLTNLADARCAAAAGADFLGFIFYARSPRFVAPPQVAAITATLRTEYGPAAPRFVGVFVDEPADRVQAVLAEAGLDLAQLHGDEPPAEVARLAPRAFKALRPRSVAEAEAALALYGDVLPGARRPRAGEPALLEGSGPREEEPALPEGSGLQAGEPALPEGLGLRAGEPAQLEAELPQLLVDAFQAQQYGGTGAPADLAAARLLAGRCRLLLAGGLGPDTVGPAIAAVHPWGVDVSSGVERAKGLKDHDRLRAFVRAVQAADQANCSDADKRR